MVRIKSGRRVTNLRPLYQYAHLHWRAAQVSRQGYGTRIAAIQADTLLLAMVAKRVIEACTPLDKVDPYRSDAITELTA